MQKKHISHDRLVVLLKNILLYELTIKCKKIRYSFVF